MGILPVAVSLEPIDRHRWLLVPAGGVLGSALLLAVTGLPAVDLHGPLHHLGVMDPFCGGTRALWLMGHGRITRAWTYNPLPVLLVAAALAAMIRPLAAAVTGRWLTITVIRRRATVLIVVLLLAVLEVNQQAHAALLTATGIR